MKFYTQGLKDVVPDKMIDEILHDKNYCVTLQFADIFNTLFYLLKTINNLRADIARRLLNLTSQILHLITNLLLNTHWFRELHRYYIMRPVRQVIKFINYLVFRMLIKRCIST